LIATDVIMSINVRQFSSDKILKHLDRVSEWVEGGNPFPITVELDMTDFCNHKCPECVASYFRKESKANMSRSKARRIVKQLAEAKVRGLIFTGGGEPLCNAFTLEIVEYAKSLGLDIGFITNGTLINGHVVGVLLKHCTWIRVSLDAGSPEVYEKTHGMGKADYDRVIANIDLLVEMKKVTSSKCTIGVGFLTNEESIKDMLKATRLMKDIGVDYIQFRPMQIHRGGKFSYHWANVDKEIAICSQLATPEFQVLFSQHKYEMAHDPQYGRYYKKCYGQQFASVISASSKMYICCHTRGYDKYCIGDLTRKSFKQIWNSKKRREAIKNINFCDCIPLCRDNTFNQILWNIVQPREHVNFL